MRGLEVRARDRLRELELDVELQVDGEGSAAIVGPSGAGKSTVLRIIAGLRRPDPGRVVMRGEVWLDSGRGINLRPEERTCGLMFQDYALFPHMSAWRNVAFGMPGPRQDRRGRALEQLRRFGVGELADARPASLSGGERQRVALARSLARDPSVLLLDEPLAALDTRTRAHAGRELVHALRGTSALAIVVTHDFSEAAMLADEIFVMDEGRIVQRGTAAELSARPASAFVADFAGSVVLNGMARARRGRVDAGRAGWRRRPAQHRPDPRAGRCPCLSVGGQPRAGWGRPRELGAKPPPGRGHLGDGNREPRPDRIVLTATAGRGGDRRIDPLAGPAPGRPSHGNLEGDSDPARLALASRRSGSSTAVAGGIRAR